MATDEDAQTGMDIDLLAASLRADASDLGAFVEALAVKLEEAVPGGVSVERRRDGMFGPKRVQRIALEAGGRRLELRVAGSGLQTSCARLSGGIVIKNEQLPTDAWLNALSESLAEQAQHSKTTREALERLLNG